VEQLLEIRKAAMAEIEALEEKITQTMLVLNSRSNHLPVDERNTQEAQLWADIKAWRGAARERRNRVAWLNDRILARMEYTGILDVLDDPKLCQLCVTHAANIQYTCCGYADVCVGCASRLRTSSSRCPHCRCDRPEVRRFSAITRE
jgi:hypothetical protein